MNSVIPSLINRTLINRKGLVVVAVIAILALGTYLLVPSNLDFPKNSPGQKVSINIANGELGSDIAKKLKEAGVVKSTKPFLSALNSDPKARAIAPGVHLVNSHLTTKEAIAQLSDPKLISNLVIVKDGSTLSDVLKSLKGDSNIIFNTSEIKSVRPLFANPRNSLEGSLRPANYSFGPKTDLKQALTQMVDQTRMSPTIRLISNGFNGFTPYQLLTIASLIQIEGDPTSANKVAQVIYNRLKSGMPLQLNSTVQYASGIRGKIALSTRATQLNSPYNTYRNQGLPPTPISNPSDFAIKATVNPTPGDWIYFITVAPGDTRFTKSFTEFQNWTTEFNKNLSLGEFK
jgi:UPF0755 protein